MELFKKILFIFRERGREGERERNINQLPLTRPPLGIWPTTQACALTRESNQDNQQLFGSQRSIH